MNYIFCIHDDLNINLRITFKLIPMKKKLLLTCMLFIGFLSSFANDNSIESSVMTELRQINLDSSNEKEHKQQDNIGRRTPSRLIPCSIDTTEGVRFLNGDNPDFIFYEIADCSGNIVFATGDETDFIENLFSRSGSYEISLTDESHTYKGVVELY